MDRGDLHFENLEAERVHKHSGGDLNITLSRIPENSGLARALKRESSDSQDCTLIH